MNGADLEYGLVPIKEMDGSDFTLRVHGLVCILMERLEDQDRIHKCPTSLPP